ncbi:acyltransferase [Mucilaginibacter celer]|uniref:Acyltransferase n=1 Tax=Mucilaginibacter celer TaxID=2305508 RepID=A0A494VIA4_9SPHI|nr:acyltransferase [Mucilaginibacter celer]AYL94596.1 acyltransferase [Mucilaginibacter celer]
MLVEKIIRKLKRNPDYKWESRYTLRDLRVILTGRLGQILRGSWVRLFLKHVEGLLFIGSNVKIRHAYLVSAGKNLIIEDNVFINALSFDGILIKDNVSIARNCTLIGTGIVSQKGKGIKIGSNTGINAGTYLGGQGGIDIGDNVIIGPGVQVFSENHNFSDLNVNIKDQGVSRDGVVIKNDCWIGAGAIILAGVTIGSGCVIAAGSVVTRSVGDDSVVAGVPGKVLKNRKVVTVGKVA